MDRLFLDANVLFSAAYRSDAGVQRLWSAPKAELVTSDYAVEEATRNLVNPDQGERLDGLLESVEIVPAGVLDPDLRGGDYQSALNEVREMGLDPAKIPHHGPADG